MFFNYGFLGVYASSGIAGSYGSFMGCPSGSGVKNPPAMQEMQETQVRALGGEDPLEECMTTHSSIGA